MDQRRPPHSQQEARVPASKGDPRPTRPLSPEDLDALVPAADPIVQAAYGRTGALPRPAMAREADAADALVIQRGAKQTRVLNFRVEGVHWRAGFAPDPSATPIGQYLPSPIPPALELRTGNGFILRPVETGLELVLRDLVPERLLEAGEAMFGRARDLAQIYLYFIPHAEGAAVGMLAWYVASPTARAHLLYLQTEVKKADPRLLEDMRQTFLASLAVRQEDAGRRANFDFWRDLQQATSELNAIYSASSLARNSAAVKSRVSAARESAESGLDSWLRGSLRFCSLLLEIFIIRLPQRAILFVVVSVSRLMIGGIRFLDRLMGTGRG